MLDNDYRNKEPELVKLVSFAYDLHKDGLSFWGEGCDLFPRRYTYNHDSYETKRIHDGIVWGKRGYSNHSTDEIYTNLGLSIGEIKNGKLIFDYAILFGVDTRHDDVFISLLECNDTSRFEPSLDITNAWSKLSGEERIHIFIKAMVSLGFLEQDIRDVINGKMTAREAYMNAAPEDKKHIQWVDYGRRHYEFYDNIAVGGHFGNILNFDDFPFPFEGELIIDCSKCKTAAISLKDNKRKVRLINVNQNRDSLKYANVRNAIIDEVIDLSKVDACRTVFGHHKVCGFEHSIAKIETMNLSLATDQNGNKLKVDQTGIAQTNCFGEPVIEENSEKKAVQVLANIDNVEMMEQANSPECSGVGLVRTETKFYEYESISKFFPLFIEYEPDQELLEEFQEEYRNFLEELFKNFCGQRIVIRLFDFRFKDVLKSIPITAKDLEDEYNSQFVYESLMQIRGSKYLCYNKDLLSAMANVILSLAAKYGREIDILVPYIEKDWDLVEIREVIEEENEKIGAHYRYGAMIENVTAVDQADFIAKRVDFVSIGLNDLTESLTGKTRETGCPEFYYLNDELKAVIEEIIYRVNAGNPNTTIGICGEHTSMVENVDFFLEAGIDYLSVNPSSLQVIKNRMKKSSHSLRFTLPNQI